MHPIAFAGKIARLIALSTLLAIPPSAMPNTAHAQWVGGGWYDGRAGADWQWVPVPEEVTVPVGPPRLRYYSNYGYPGYGYYPGAAYGFPGYAYPWYGNAYAAGYARGFDNGYGHGFGAGYAGGYSNGFPGYGYPYPSY